MYERPLIFLSILPFLFRNFLICYKEGVRYKPNKEDIWSKAESLSNAEYHNNYGC